MKKIAKYFFAALAVASAVSCAKELTDDFRPADKVQQGKSYTFTATMADTKSVIDEETLENLWMGDKDGKEYISVLQPATDLDVDPEKIDAKVILYSASDIYEPTSVAQFSQDNEKADGIKGNVVYAVYPSANWKVFEGKDKEDETKTVVDSVRVIADYAAIQKPVAGTYDPKAPVAVAYNADIEASQDLHFMNTSALLKLQFTKTTGTVNSVKIIALGGEKISGEMLVLGIEDGAPVLVPTDAAKSHVEMVATEADGFEKGATYYIAIAPAVLSQGVALQFNEDEVQTYTVSGEIVIERGKVYDLGTFSCEEPEDAWYLVGDYNVGNANSIRKASFVEVEGKDLLVAKDVTIADGQGFKVYNPKQGVVLYPEVTDLEKNEWFPLTKDAGYGYAAMSYETYDVYVDYVNKEMTGIILVEAGAEAPEFATPDQLFTAVRGDVTYAFDMTQPEALIYGRNYDEYAAADQYLNYKDPTMVGKWTIDVKAEYKFVPKDAMSGEIIASDEYGEYKISYSNYHRDSVAIYAPTDPFSMTEAVVFNACAEEVEFAYPVPYGQYVFMASDESEAMKVFDLGIAYEGALNIGTHFDLSHWDLSDEERQYYNFWGAKDNYTLEMTGEYEVIPTGNQSGTIVYTVMEESEDGEPVPAEYTINYSMYTYNQYISLQSEDLAVSGFAMNLASYEVPEAKAIPYEIPEMPAGACDTPEGNQYTWFYTDYECDKVIDFGATADTTIFAAFDYNTRMGVPEDALTGEYDYTKLSDDFWWNPEMIGTWISNGEVYPGYTITPTSEDSGVITLKNVVTNWFGTRTVYQRIVYSDLTETSVKLFSPSQFVDENYNNLYPVYDPETGEPVIDEESGMPCYWEGIGLCEFDEDWNSLPVEVELSDEFLTVCAQDMNRMTPDKAQWVIYDTTPAETWMGEEGVRTMISLGGIDLSLQGGKAGDYFGVGFSMEDLSGDKGDAGVWMVPGSMMPWGFYTEYEVVPDEMDPTMGVITLSVAQSGAASEEAEDNNMPEEEVKEINIPYSDFNPYSGTCTFDLSAYGVEGKFLAFIAPNYTNFLLY